MLHKLFHCMCTQLFEDGAGHDTLGLCDNKVKNFAIASAARNKFLDGLFLVPHLLSVAVSLQFEMLNCLNSCAPIEEDKRGKHVCQAFWGKSVIACNCPTTSSISNSDVFPANVIYDTNTFKPTHELHSEK